MRKIDIWVITVLLMLALGWFGWRELRTRADAGLSYVILVDGIETASGLITGDGYTGPFTFSVPERPGIVFRVEDERVAFIESDCPDKICVKTGYLSAGGQSAACLPNGVILLVRGNAEGGEVDAVLRLP